MSKKLAILLLVLGLLVVPIAGCGSDAASEEPEEAEEVVVSEEATEAVEEEVAEEEEVAVDAAGWVEPDPVPQAIGVLTDMASQFSASDFTGSVGARSDSGSTSWVRVEVAPNDPAYEGELFYMRISTGDAEWTIVDFGTGLTANDLETQGVPAAAAADINPY